MLNRPVRQRFLGGQLRRRQRLARGLEHAQVQTVRRLVVESQAEEAEPNDRPELARQASEQRVAIVIGAQRLGDADQGLVTGGG